MLSKEWRRHRDSFMRSLTPLCSAVHTTQQPLMKHQFQNWMLFIMNDCIRCASPGMAQCNTVTIPETQSRCSSNIINSIWFYTFFIKNSVWSLDIFNGIYKYKCLLDRKVQQMMYLYYRDGMRYNEYSILLLFRNYTYTFSKWLWQIA